jgi:hypothetical protein
LLVGSTQLVPHVSGVAGGHIVVHAKPPSSGAQSPASPVHALPHPPQFAAIDGSTQPASPHSISVLPQPASGASASPPSSGASPGEASVAVIVPVSVVASTALTWFPSIADAPASQFSVHGPVE